MKKKLLSLLLAITLIFGTLPISAFATDVSGTTYRLSDIGIGQTFVAGDKVLWDTSHSKDATIWINGTQKATLPHGSSYTFQNIVKHTSLDDDGTGYYFSAPCTVSFDMQGHGTQIGAKTDVEYDSKVTAPNAPTDTDYTFMGWYKEKACNNQWDFDSDTVTSDMTLYAKWKSNFTPVTDITGVPTTGTVGTLTLSGTVEPADATNQTIRWSVAVPGTTGATITTGNNNQLNTTGVGTVVVTATVENGETASSNYAKAFYITINRKANASTPVTPTILKTNYPSREIKTSMVYNTQEYVISTSSEKPTDWSGSHWGAGNITYFRNLTPSTKYYVHTRIRETDTTEASDSVYAECYTLPTTPSESSVTINYAAETITYDDTTLEVYTAQESGTLIANNGTISPSNMETYICVRVKGNASTGAPASQWAYVAIPARPATPIGVNTSDVTKTDKTITIANTVSGQEYSVDETNWQDSGSFTGLTADTTFYISTRVKAESSAFASKKSNILLVDTLKTIAIAPNTAKLTQTYDSTTPVDLTDLFRIMNGYDGTLTYTVINGTGTGTVSNNALTVTKAGTFTVNLEASAIAGYAANSKEVTLTVKKAEGDGDITINNWTYGDAANPPVPTSTTNGTDNVTYLYRNVNGNPTYSSTNPPTNAGTYWIDVTFPETDLYQEVGVSTVVTIYKREITVEKGNYKITKTYDGTTGAGTGAGTLAVTNIISADSGVTVKVGTIPAYSNSTVGDYELTVPISIDGDTNSNYKIKDDATTIQVPAEILSLVAPSITGVTDGATYYVTQKVTISGTNLDEEKVTLNGNKAASPITLEGNKAQSYVIKAENKSGDKIAATVSMKPIASITAGFSTLTVDNVKSSNKAEIEAAQTILNNIDLTNATQAEKNEVAATKKLCEDLLAKIKATNSVLSDSPTGTKVEAVGDTTFDPNTALVVTKATPSQKDALSVTGLEKGKEIVSLFDISLMVGDKKVQPNGKVKVTLTLTEEQLAAYTDFKIVYIDENGNAAIIPCTVNGNQITFETDHFSGYGIIGTKRSGSNSPKTGDSNNMLPYIMLALASAGGIMLISKKRKKV